MKKLRDILEKNETVIYKTPERKAPPPKNWVQSMFGSLYGEPKVEPVKPLPQFDKNQSAMPDMDTMVKQEKPQVSKTIPDQTGVAKANTPVGSFPIQKPPEPKVGSLVVQQHGYPAAEKPKAPIPTAKPEQSTKIIKKGDTFWDIAGGNPKEVERLKKLNPKVNPSKLQIGQKIRLK